MTSDTDIVAIPEDNIDQFGKRPVVCKHKIDPDGLFSDQALTDLLSDFPRDRLRVWTSGSDPRQFSDWQPVDTTGLTGADLFECIKIGRLWINIQRVDLYDAQFATLSNGLYSGLSRQCPSFEPDFIHSYILLSSPKAFIYLHLDSYENFFWCVRGGKEFHLYPPDDRRMVSQELMEDICAGSDDFFENKPEFDALYQTYDVRPGDMMSWPQHSPHQIYNNDEVNVGYGTFHVTPQGNRYVTDYAASRYFRECLPFLHGQVRHGALPTVMRRYAYLVSRRFNQLPQMPATQFWTNYRLDPHSQSGIRTVENGPILAECSRVAQEAG